MRKNKIILNYNSKVNHYLFLRERLFILTNLNLYLRLCFVIWKDKIPTGSRVSVELVQSLYYEHVLRPLEESVPFYFQELKKFEQNTIKPFNRKSGGIMPGIFLKKYPEPDQ